MPKESRIIRSKDGLVELPRGRSLDDTSKRRGITFEATTPREILTPDEKNVRDLIRFSTQFSQGHFDLQKKYFYWLKANDHLEGMEFPQETPRFIVDMPIPVKHTSISAAQQKEFNQVIYGKLHTIVTQPPAEVPMSDRYTDLIGEITKDLILKDDDYQIKERPGRTPGPIIEPDGINDPHASFLRRYVLKDTLTGSPTFDMLFAEVREEVLPDVANVQAGLMQTTRQSQLARLVSRWETNHPNESFYI